jgi:hypothetical protein
MLCIERILNASGFVFRPRNADGIRKDWIPALPGKGLVGFRLGEPQSINT